MHGIKFKTKIPPSNLYANNDFHEVDKSVKATLFALLFQLGEKFHWNLFLPQYTITKRNIKADVARLYIY